MMYWKVWFYRQISGVLHMRSALFKIRNRFIHTYYYFGTLAAKLKGGNVYTAPEMQVLALACDTTLDKQEWKQMWTVPASMPIPSSITAISVILFEPFFFRFYTFSTVNLTSILAALASMELSTISPIPFAPNSR